jgi:hypothetical protein
VRDLESLGGLLDLVVHGHVGKDVVEKDVSHRAGRIAKVPSFISSARCAFFGSDHDRDGRLTLEEPGNRSSP